MTLKMPPLEPNITIGELKTLVISLPFLRSKHKIHFSFSKRNFHQYEVPSKCTSKISPNALVTCKGWPDIPSLQKKEKMRNTHASP
jgi:hypothetical protein